MTDDIDELVTWQMTDSPAAHREHPRKLHGPASALPGLALPAGMCPHVALDSTQVVEDRSEQ